MKSLIHPLIVDAYRAVLIAIFTVQQWCEMTEEQRTMQNVGQTGLDMKALATAFGVKNYKPEHIANHLSLAKAIYGDEYARAITPQVEMLITLRATFTADEWYDMPYDRQMSDDIAQTGMGLEQLAIFLEVSDYTRQRVGFDALGKKIYGDNYFRVKVNDPDEARAFLKKAFTPQQWRNMTTNEHLGNNIGRTGRGMVALARIFGLKLFTIATIEGHDQLGEVIFGEQYAQTLSPLEQAKALIKKTFTADEWCNLTNDELRSNIAETGRGILSLAKLLELETESASFRVNQDAVGAFVYGESYPSFTDQLIARIKSKYTADQWHHMKTRHRMAQDFAGTGMGMGALTALFGLKIERKRQRSIKSQHALGRIIFGTDYPM